jgi:hypothetical protein
MSCGYPNAMQTIFADNESKSARQLTHVPIGSQESKTD